MRGLLKQWAFGHFALTCWQITFSDNFLETVGQVLIIGGQPDCTANGFDGTNTALAGC
jgi:hypothetical protein